MRVGIAARPAEIPPAVDVLIAGGGPVGLLLANLLGRRGRSVLLAECRSAPPAGSMAIGITPPSLAILRELDLDHTFTARGTRIETARVFERGDHLGRVDFSRLPGAYPFMLSLPQQETVDILRDRLRSCPSVRYVDGLEVEDLQPTAGGVRVRVRDLPTGNCCDVNAAYLVGCDGHRSTVRRRAGIPSHSRRYPCRFIMADFEDNTGFGDEAHLYFGPDGSVESFPLPGGRRRWVIQQTSGTVEPQAYSAEVAHGVRERIGIELGGSAPGFASAFQPGYALAAAYRRDQVVLCGDAAHIMSPIGGQGMNTGFGDAAHLTRTLAGALHQPADAARLFDRYATTRRRAFRVAARRAARGMWLGTRTGPAGSFLRRALIAHVLFRPPLHQRLAPYFAMLTIPQDSGDRKETA